MFERGFKAWCERYSTEVRGKLGVQKDAPLDTRALAQMLGIRVWTPHDVPGLTPETLEILLRSDGKTPSCWSAVTIVVNKRVVVVLNSSHSLARQASDLAHELAHRIRGHQARVVSLSEDGIMLLSSYDKKEEEEADWLSGSLLLPRDALILIRRRRLSDADATIEYGVSARMLSYRMSMTGVNRQFA
ncbi:ImmA/IrrE family metallo-endopeptidase [Paludibacterium sp.]|uniref:ImmA/IrrE family metallo-endopeptidase n=1 Tax=Paludibacterium sp. TaxID=1917523 RepID=UPI0025D2DA71|nr:ImmA/IrrE family metallo-endopeptidase [Paludibacterium sp.]MBV8646337.1 ImmA/IrrE family metallo-endopeptidase [Paludibacterium sp.]